VTFLTDLVGELSPVRELDLYLDGNWSPAADSARFASFDPATGEIWASVAEAGPADVDRAVAAARRAFEGP